MKVGDFNVQMQNSVKVLLDSSECIFLDVNPKIIYIFSMIF